MLHGSLERGKNLSLIKCYTNLSISVEIDRLFSRAISIIANPTLYLFYRKIITTYSLTLHFFPYCKKNRHDTYSEINITTMTIYRLESCFSGNTLYQHAGGSIM